VFNGNTNEHSSAEIAALMTGREIIMPENTDTSCAAQKALEIGHVNALSDRGYLALNDLNLTVHGGEIVGLAGVSGNGQRELAEVINGLRRVGKGTITFFGNDITNKTPKEIIKAGMGYIPEERNTEGIVPPFSVKENFILKDAGAKQFTKGIFQDKTAITENAAKLRTEFDIRCPSTDVAAGTLSGGNIQKVILAREITRRPKFLVAVYPIRGLDLGAAQFIHEQLLAKRKEGLGILLISEELDEILALSDRIAVIFKGHIQQVLQRSEADSRKLGMLMAGV
jgi:simple sugar transport system ATP-binding protein